MTTARTNGRDGKVKREKRGEEIKVWKRYKRKNEREGFFRLEGAVSTRLYSYGRITGEWQIGCDLEGISRGIP
jgi:hypothetical protein